MPAEMSQHPKIQNTEAATGTVILYYFNHFLGKKTMFNTDWEITNIVTSMETLFYVESRSHV